jgi:glyoxylase-like metal-dependent hydrolase (beta-lactamase superfamily II)
MIPDVATHAALDVQWIHGTPPGGPKDPPVQVHKVDDGTFILRQSKDLDYEGNFLFLLCGAERAILLDTGAVAEDGGVRETVDAALEDRGSEYPLVVAHTHGHGDHVAGDEAFRERPHTTVVARDVEAVREFFGFGDDWPDETVSFDLGDRVLSLIGSPGHHQAAITVYDEATGFLLTGDTVLRGRLYVQDMPAFAATMDRLADFASEHPVTQVLGCHIEMTRTPGRDYPLGCTYQPDEPPLEMSLAQLLAARDAAHSAAARPGAHVFDDFIVYNGMNPKSPALLRLTVRGLGWKVKDKLTRILAGR